MKRKLRVGEGMRFIEVSGLESSFQPLRCPRQGKAPVELTEYSFSPRRGAVNMVGLRKREGRETPR